jgi:hypothetical protein
MVAWARQDPAAAIEWAMRMPEGNARDAALGAFSGAIVERYPQIATVVADEIGDAAMRENRARNLRDRVRAAGLKHK